MTRIDHLSQAFTCAAYSGAGPRPAWNSVDVLELPGIPDDHLVTGLANSDRCVERTLRLRYEVFNLELGEGLTQSAVEGIDKDAFDDQMDHLVLIDPQNNMMAGTYRLQTITHGLTKQGIYSAQEFDLEPLRPYFDKTVELGRACLAKDYRTFSSVLTLWYGIRAYLDANRHRYLFGCCSLTSQDPDDGWRALKTIRDKHYLHPELWLRARPSHSCGDPSREFDAEIGPAISLPKLFRTYMRLGAQVISEPAIDREFGTVDFLVMIDAASPALSRLAVREPAD